jgi:hypothetical protein
MIITINGKDYEVNSENEMIALMERFGINEKRTEEWEWDFCESTINNEGLW